MSEVQIIEEEETPRTPEESAALALNAYTLAKLCLETFIQQNEGVINFYGHLQKAVVETEAEAKEAIRAFGAGIENDSFIATIVKPMKRWYDAGFIIDNWPQVVDMPGVMEVNRNMVAMLAEKGKIPKAIADAALREEPQTPRVTIKVKQ